MASPAQYQKYLHGLDYPAKKQKLLDTAKKNGAPDDIISNLEKIKGDSFESPVAVSKALGSII